MKYNFKKKDLIKVLSINAGYSKNYSKKIIDDLIEILIQEISNGYLNIKNLGTFKIIKKKPRIGRNPKTGQEHIIAARNSIKFILSKNIENKLNI